MNEPLFTLRTEQGGSRRAFVAVADAWERRNGIPAPKISSEPKARNFPARMAQLALGWLARHRPVRS